MHSGNEADFNENLKICSPAPVECLYKTDKKGHLEQELFQLQF